MTRIVTTILVVGLLVAGCSSGTSTTAGDPAAVQQTSAVIEDEIAAMIEEDPAGISAVYADDLAYFDASMAEETITKGDIEEMTADPAWWDLFDVEITSFFVSGDGRFAAELGAFSSPAGGLDGPSLALRAVEADQIVWAYDYYGGGSSVTAQMLTFEPSMFEADSPEAGAAVEETTAAVDRWLDAYNGHDADTLLEAYAVDAIYVDVVSPEWRVLSKDELASDVASRFARSRYESTLGPSPEPTDPGRAESPIDPFIVSVDGRFVAVQGSYKDDGMIATVPMVTILELRDGLISQQFNFMLVGRNHLEP